MSVARSIRPDQSRRSELEVFETILYDRLPDQRVQCAVCQRRCVISEGKRGYCETRLNREGQLCSLIYVGNVHGHPAENTHCPQCGNLLIQRGGFSILRNDIAGGKCIHWGSPIWGTFDS